ncbi:MAG: exodeoxyribonuclease VII large subunit [Rhodoferax sp.]|nr:exodeoxyribonuclease VII large subunit [Rhodoferax sp.]
MSLAPSLLPVSGTVWAVGALCRAIADALQARFNPVTVRGELSGFSRAASGHCYFSLKDASGQLRCAMFKRAASGLDFAPRDGELVEVQGRLGVYEPRGDLQLIVEGMRRAGQGNLFEEFLKLKARLEAQGLFDAARKRALPLMPRAIGLVTSLGAAALHDVVTALQRRVPHIPVVLAPASVQGANAPAELMAALSALYQCKVQPIDVILMVRGGGALEDLWAFNDEALARLMVQSPVPIICGVGHETDFTIADFCADLRAPTPTAAAELVAQPREAWLGALDQAQRRLGDAVLRQLDRQGQRLDRAVARLGRPSERLTSQHLRLAASAHGLQSAARHFLQQKEQHQQRIVAQLPTSVQRARQQQAQRLERASLRLNLLDPHLVLARGYAMLSDDRGNTIASCQQTAPGQAVKATLVDGTVDLSVV